MSRKKTRSAAWLLLASLWTMPALAAEPPPAGPMAGFARYEFNKWLFRPCLGTGPSSKLVSDALIFIDASRGRETFSAIQQRWQQSADPLRGIYLEFSGYEENGRVSATDLQRALGWVESCAQRPTNVAAETRLWAAGNEPGWNFVVGPRAAVWRTPEGEIELPLRPLQHAGDTVAYDAALGTRRLRIELTTGLCSDTMSEAAFGRRAVVAFEGRLFTGCGLLR